MKSPKGFRGRYFSLAAILALSTTITLANEVQSVASVQENVTTQEEFDEKEELTPSHEELDVVVVSKKIKTKESDATFASEIYTKSQIEKSKAKDIYEFLNTQTSLTLFPSYGGNTFSLLTDMRGYGIETGYENVVITLDGRRLNNIDMGSQLIGTIPLDSIEKIEILKGSGSVEYGDGANAGVINIITKSYDGASIKSYIGDNGLQFVSLGAGIKKEKFSLSGYIDDFSYDGAKIIHADGSKDKSWSRTKELKGTFSPLENLTFNLGKSFTKLYIKYPGSLTLDEYNTDVNTIPSGNYTQRNYDSNILSYGVKYKINNQFNFEFQGNSEDKTSDWGSASSQSKYEYKSYDTKINYESQKLKLALGIQYFDGIRIGSTNETSKDNLGIYTKAEYSQENHSFTFGARQEKVEYEYSTSGSNLKDDFKLNAYDIGYNYKLDSKSSVFMNFNQSFQAPDIDKFFATNTTTYATEFNGFINPMKAQTYNFGYSYLGYPNKLKMSVFYSRVRDEIYYNPFLGAWGTNTNLDKTKKYGLEVYDKYNILYNLFATLNYTYVDTKILQDSTNSGGEGRGIPGVSKHNVKIALGYNPMHRVNLLLSHVFKSKAYAMSDFDGTFGKMEAYNSTDFSATYKYKNYEVFAKVNNLFDKSNALFAVGYSGSLGVYPVNYERNFVLGFNAKF